MNTNEIAALATLALVVVCATVLTALHVLDSQAFVALIGGLVGGLVQKYITGRTPPPPPSSESGQGKPVGSALAVGPTLGMLAGGLGAHLGLLG